MISRPKSTKNVWKKTKKRGFVYSLGRKRLKKVFWPAFSITWKLVEIHNIWVFWVPLKQTCYSFYQILMKLALTSLVFTTHVFFLGFVCFSNPTSPPRSPIESGTTLSYPATHVYLPLKCSCQVWYQFNFNITFFNLFQFYTLQLLNTSSKIDTFTVA